jgi:hypothetical protein
LGLSDRHCGSNRIWEGFSRRFSRDVLRGRLSAYFFNSAFQFVTTVSAGEGATPWQESRRHEKGQCRSEEAEQGCG